MKSLALFVFLLLPVISFSGNCIEAKKIVTPNDASDFILADPQCPLRFLSVTIYDRWGNKRFADSIQSISQISVLNKSILNITYDKDFKEATYYAIVKYAFRGEPDTVTINTSVAFVK